MAKARANSKTGTGAVPLSALAPVHPDRLKDDDLEILRAVENRFDSLTKGKDQPPLFTTDVNSKESLYDVFLRHLPIEIQPLYRCNSCRRFVETYGGLVMITPTTGETSSVFWPPEVLVPDRFANAITAVRKAVERAKVTGVFLSDGDPGDVWGTPVNHDKKRGCDWRHFAVVPSLRLLISKKAYDTANQVCAKKANDFAVLSRSLSEFNLETAQIAVEIIKSDVLYRGEKALGPVKWFMSLHQILNSNIKNREHRRNLVWLAAATAPVGFAHIRSSMAGTLLEDIAAGLPTDLIRSRFAEKMNPLQYRRPTAPSTLGNIAQAEKVVERLGIAPSLRRRFARMEDIRDYVWRAPRDPVESKTNQGGVFDHLRPQQGLKISDTLIPEATMTWVKFLDTVLPEAVRIEFRVPVEYASYIALVTAVDPEAPPILQWDPTSGERNPVSWYVYTSGSSAANWGLRALSYVDVPVITRLPCHWFRESSIDDHHGDGVVLILNGARDLGHVYGGGFFPECLRPELHEVRSTLEHYASRATIEESETATACGVDLRKSRPWANIRLRVTKRSGVRAIYRLDRWD